MGDDHLMSLIGNGVNISNLEPDFLSGAGPSSIGPSRGPKKQFRAGPYDRGESSEAGSAFEVPDREAGKVWGVNCSGHDFLINRPNRPDLIKNVTHLARQETCPICDHRSETGESRIAESLREIVERKDFVAARAFLAAVAPELADAEIIQVHFDHAVEDEDKRLVHMVDNLIDTNYKIATALGKEYAMIVTANNCQLTVPNDKNIKGMTAAVANIEKLIKTRQSLKNK